MAVETIALRDDFDKAVARAAGVMENGGVVVFPTETVYGIGVVSGDTGALEALRRLKGRDRSKPFQLLVDGIPMAMELGAVFPDKARRLAARFWPGPMTLVLPGSGGATLGIRIPDSPFVQALCRSLGRAVVSSSANPAGGPAPHDAAAADAFGDAVALLVDGGTVEGGIHSTVVDCAEHDYAILRGGAISAAAVAAAWNE